MQPTRLIAATLTLALAACDGATSPQPDQARQWVADQLTIVEGWSPAEQAEYFAEVSEELDEARRTLPQQSIDPALDAEFAAQIDPSELAPGGGVTCDLSMSGCVDWSASTGCREMLICCCVHRRPLELPQRADPLRRLDSRAPVSPAHARARAARPTRPGRARPRSRRSSPRSPALARRRT
ncbi:MAG: hypothetical protein U0168_01310 [Nannocystaceae bacterium]